MIHLFHTYVVFKCFILHVFPIGEWGAVSRWPADVACGALGADGRGCARGGEGVTAGAWRTDGDRGEARLWGRGERMGMGAGKSLGRSGMRAGIQWNSSPSDVRALAFPPKFRSL